jgi:hypothetical protein
MFNFYLCNKSYEKANITQIEENLRVLNDLVVMEHKEEDFFWMSESILYCDTADGGFSDIVFSKIQDKQLLRQVLPRLFQTIHLIPQTFSTLKEFDQAGFRTYNAFYGVIFDKPVSERYISDKETYVTFREKCLRDINPKSLWERKEKLFSKLILCPGVEDNLNGIGEKHLQQIFKRLVALDIYALREWVKGKFDYRKANEVSSLRISPESEATMSQKKYRDLRLFKMPDGTTECFELHIKTGDLRFHFYPDDGNVFVGYIGKHLPTAKY